MSLRNQFVRARQEKQFIKALSDNGNGHALTAISPDDSPPNPRPRTMKKPQPFTRRGSPFVFACP
ncbi:MAG: hypothetical protein UX89_C0023G0002 [Parcubacteria group bacterium GW2011_GWA2_47_16]|nr:MAG: hypothetical protein UX89_C0023G0002 [Parcubacteria group bacterium GW2011_GWA2_47_16]